MHDLTVGSIISLALGNRPLCGSLEPMAFTAQFGALRKRNFLQCQLSNLGIQCLQVDHRDQFGLRRIARNTYRTLQQQVTPLLDLVRKDVKALRQLDQRSITLDCRYSDLGLEARAMVPARSSHHGHFPAFSIMLPSRGKSTYAPDVQFSQATSEGVPQALD